MLLKVTLAALVYGLRYVSSSRCFTPSGLLRPLSLGAGAARRHAGLSCLNDRVGLYGLCQMADALIFGLLQHAGLDWAQPDEVVYAGWSVCMPGPLLECFEARSCARDISATSYPGVF
jgi:hypothetical protein